MINFTRTELALLRVLSDGMPHTKEELAKCLWDDLASMRAIPAHMCNIRKKLREANRQETIVKRNDNLYDQVFYS